MLVIGILTRSNSNDVDGFTISRSRSFSFYNIETEKINIYQTKLTAWDGTQYVYYRGKNKVLNIQLRYLDDEDKKFLNDCIGEMLSISFDNEKYAGKIINDSLTFRRFKTTTGTYLYETNLTVAVKVGE